MKNPYVSWLKNAVGIPETTPEEVRAWRRAADYRTPAQELAADDHYGDCCACGYPALVSPAGYCEPCLTLAFALQDETSTPAARKAAKIAILLRATWR